ncbi:MAG: SPFH domain-containing protein [Acidobacteria bacterium]|nr:SPFH domain-containing protein [Acidobacteriota bacterium]MBK8148283.1 SPFH domain-containing protein [Acidobacteriota bacterium]MBK8813435.1 SPFH domain-containing protein [Acidobacteriota bacterium]
MSIWEKVKNEALNQFIEVIEWLDDSQDTLLYRFPVHGQEIKNGAQLIVRESQAAVFVHEGQAADAFGPGRYTIDGGNTPILSKLGAWKHGFNSPIKSEVYFVNTKQFTDMKWGTANPIMMRDADFGIVQLRAFGAYSLRVADPQTFIKEVAGTNAHFQTEDIDAQLKRAIVTEFSDALGELKIPALDLASQYKELGEQIRAKINEDFKAYGLEVTKFYVENISVPPAVQEAIDKRAAMGALGDAQRYMQFQAADALRDAAQNEGGGAGLGAGLGAGFAVGNQMVNALGGGMAPQGGGQAQAPQNPMVPCPTCGKPNVAGTKFCGDCGGKMEVAKVPCVKCGAELREGAKFCSECGSSQEKPKCANCQAEMNPGAKFCNECGTKVE